MMKKLGRFRVPLFQRCLLIVLCLAVNGCATYNPRPLTEVPFFERAQTKGDDRVRVTVSVLDARESRDAFGVDLAGKGIQPVWIKVENNDSVPYWLAQSHLDPDYYSPGEAAYKSRYTFPVSANKEMEDHFEKLGMGPFIPPRSVASGFVYTTMDHGTKEVNVTLLGPEQTRWFTFFVFVPGIETDYQHVDFDALYSPGEIVSHDRAGLKSALEALPCCATNKDGTGMADPLNLVFIGEVQDVFGALIRSGWSETETLSAQTAWKTLKAFLFRSEYLYSPVSPLYVFGRPQDVAFQKARETIDERNHLRLWMTPMRYKGKPVWIGQISRDIGVKFTTRTWYFMTHKIDSNIDAERWYLIQDLISSEGIAQVGYVRGVGAAPPSEPRPTLTNDYYFTDGLRAVITFSDKPVSYSQLQFTAPSALMTSQLMESPFKSSPAGTQTPDHDTIMEDEPSFPKDGSTDPGMDDFDIQIKGFSFTSGITPNAKGLPDGVGDGIKAKKWCGRGVMADPDGTVLTSYHVARRARSGTVIVNEGSSYEIETIRLYDPETGIAAVQIKPDREFRGPGTDSFDDVNILDKIVIRHNSDCGNVAMSEGVIRGIKTDDRNQPYRIHYSTEGPSGQGGETVFAGSRVIGINIDRDIAGATRNAIPINTAKRTLSEKSQRVLSLKERFARDIQSIIDKSYLIHVRNGMVPAAQGNAPQVLTFRTEFYPTEDYIIFLQGQEGTDPAVAVYDWQGHLMGYGDRRNDDFDLVLISGETISPVYVQVINHDNIPLNYALEIHKVNW